MPDADLDILTEPRWLDLPQGGAGQQPRTLGSVGGGAGQPHQFLHQRDVAPLEGRHVLG
jgi:hypothetical protein